MPKERFDLNTKDSNKLYAAISDLKKGVNNLILYNVAKKTRLAESYNQKAKRSQAFEADLSQYDEKQKAIVKKAIDSGILNNTRRTHELVDMVAKISV